jgi:neopullulanase
VWITPVYQDHGAQSYHGYSATDKYAVDEHFGTIADFKALVDSLHKLVLDTVPNYVGPAHLRVKDSPELAWFHGNEGGSPRGLGRLQTADGASCSLAYPAGCADGWFANVLPDLNQENAAIAQYLTQNAAWWIEQAGLDGLRLDTFLYVAREFWQGFHAEIHSLYPRVTRWERFSTRMRRSRQPLAVPCRGMVLILGWIHRCARIQLRSINL